MFLMALKTLVTVILQTKKDNQNPKPARHLVKEEELQVLKHQTIESIGIDVHYYNN